MRLIDIVYEAVEDDTFVDLKYDSIEPTVNDASQAFNDILTDIYIYKLSKANNHPTKSLLQSIRSDVNLFELRIESIERELSNYTGKRPDILRLRKTIQDYTFKIKQLKLQYNL